MFPLPTTRRYEEGLPKEARIPRFRDSAVPVIRGTGADTVYSPTPQCWSTESVPVPGCCIGAFSYTSKLEWPEYGPR